MQVLDRSRRELNPPLSASIKITIPSGLMFERKMSPSRPSYLHGKPTLLVQLVRNDTGTHRQKGVLSDEDRFRCVYVCHLSFRNFKSMSAAEQSGRHPLDCRYSSSCSGRTRREAEFTNSRVPALRVIIARRANFETLFPTVQSPS